MQRTKSFIIVLILMLMLPAMTLWAQEMNEKFSMTTQMFINELKEKQTQPEQPHHAPRHNLPGMTRTLQHRRLIASPDTVGGVVYISCFIHLNDVNNLSEVEALGVEIEETFDGLDFVTARVPVEQLESLAAIDNVTRIKVAQCMRPLTDTARQLTNVDDLLTHSADATALGISDKYDGTGVVLGVIDTGIDFQHIAFKDKNGNSRIKRAYVYNGSSAQEYTTITSSSPTTDDNSEDHGTHTATTAGGSSVIVSGSTVTVTDNHANATYGGMAPGADLYLAGINGLSDTYLTNALKKMVTYADGQGMPLVVSNSWGSGWGPRDGTGDWATLVGQYFGDSHPNHIILFASSNDAGHSKDNEGGGYFVKKSNASSSNPLGTIIRSASYSNTDAGYLYQGLIACAWANTRLNCKIHVLNSSTGAVLKSWTVTQNNTSIFSDLSAYYDGSMTVYIEQENGKYRLAVYSKDGIETQSSSGSSYYKSNYTLAIEVYPSSGSANINMWSGDYSYFTNHLSTSGHTWIEGTDDMCVSDEATIPDAISVGAYVSKNRVKNYQGTNYTYSSGTLGDIADFSSYATAAQSPTGLAYPWITAPGAQLVAGVNHYHTASIDDYSYFHSDNKSSLVVNSSSNPYGVMQGTSMATPVAAGIVALWLQASLDENAAHRNLTVNDVKEIMAQTAIQDSYTTTGVNASHFGQGKIDALAGIQYILGSSVSPLIKVSETSVNFNKKYTAGMSETATVNIRGLNLTGNITVTKTGSGTFTVSPQSITKAQAEADGGVDITITWTPTAIGEATATITLSSQDAEDVVIALTGNAKAPEPLILADDELMFSTGLSASQTKTFTVLSEDLTEDITASLTDANGVFTLGQTTISRTASETDGVDVSVTFSSATAGTFTGTVTLTSEGADPVTISLSGTATDAVSEYVKVTSTSDIEDGEYLIVYENGSLAFDGSLTTLDAVGNNISVTIANNKIAASETVDAATFTLTSVSGGYSIQSKSGYYIGNTSNSNNLASSQTTSYTNTISISNDGNADIVCSSSYLRYNAASNQTRFRYYKSSSYTGQQPIALYKKIGSGGTVPANVAPTWSAFPTNQTVYVGEDYELTVSDYVSGTPTPTIAMTASGSEDAGFDEGYFLFNTLTAGTYDFTFTATNSSGSANATLTVTAVAEAPTLTVSGGTSIEATVGDAVDFTVSATGHPAPTCELTSTNADSEDYDFESSTGDFVFVPSESGTFTFTFTATNSAGSDTKTVTVTVNPAPVTVPTLTVDEGVTSTTAPVFWTACDGVTEYILQIASDDQFSTGGSGSEIPLISASFEDNSIPSGWTTSGSNISIASGKSGDGDYCVAFKGTGAYLITPRLTNPTSISFMYKRSNNSTAWGLDVSYSTSTSGPWTSIGSISSASTTWNTFSATLEDLGNVYIKLEDTRSSGAHERYVDLIEVNSTEPAGGGSLISTTNVNGTTYTFTGLTPATTYYVRVKGESDWSDVVSFTTNSILALANSGDNSDDIYTASTNGGKYDVIIDGRVLYKDGAWNTLCLPFNMTETQVNAQLNPDKLMTLSSTAFNSSTGTLTLNFESVAEIVAGKPYIIKWADGDDIVAPHFTNVTISNATANVETDEVIFTGTFSPVALTAGDKSVLYLTANNYLYYPGYNMTIGSCRAYFKLNDAVLYAATPSDSNAKELNFVLNFGGEQTSVNTIGQFNDLQSGNLTIYDLQGRKVNGRLTIENGQLAPGVYIVNGKKVIIK